MPRILILIFHCGEVLPIFKFCTMTTIVLEVEELYAVLTSAVDDG
jgi:hypothetical protein